MAPSAILLVVTLPSFNGAPFAFWAIGIETFWLSTFDIRTYRNVPLLEVFENGKRTLKTLHGVEYGDITPFCFHNFLVHQKTGNNHTLSLHIHT